MENPHFIFYEATITQKQELEYEQVCQVLRILKRAKPGIVKVLALCQHLLRVIDTVAHGQTDNPIQGKSEGGIN